MCVLEYQERTRKFGACVNIKRPRKSSVLPVRGSNRVQPNYKRKTTTVTTFSPKPGDITRNWLVIDAQDVVLGRLATHVANLLRGKHKATFAPHVDGGDFVIVINADKVALTGKKATDSMRYTVSGQPGGLRAYTAGELREKDSRRLVERAVWGMMPKNKLSRAQMTKLKVYAGSQHPHAAQQPQPYQIQQIAQ